MAPARDPLLQHLEGALAAYGPDLLLPVKPPPATSHPAKAGAADDREEAESAPARPTRGWRPGAAPAAASPPASTPVGSRPAPAPRTPASTPAAAAAAPAASPPTPEPPAGAEHPAIAALRAEVLQCRKCKLCEGRRSVVFGEGTSTPPVLFVGEAPGAVEDRTGRPFVGPAGQLLDRILEGAMGLRREDVFIANVNKCRPPGNRDPEPDEVAACLPYLKQQVELLQPKVIVAMGRVAAHNLLSTTEPMRALRGRDLSYCGTPVVVTWHPAYLLREPARKRDTWEDIKRVNRLLGRPEVPPTAPG
ncbi:MAG: uracil-DNA glycosylase [Planctomycetota bacterium]